MLVDEVIPKGSRWKNKKTKRVAVVTRDNYLRPQMIGGMLFKGMSGSVWIKYADGKRDVYILIDKLRKEFDQL